MITLGTYRGVLFYCMYNKEREKDREREREDPQSSPTSRHWTFCHSLSAQLAVALVALIADCIVIGLQPWFKGVITAGNRAQFPPSEHSWTPEEDWADGKLLGASVGF